MIAWKLQTVSGWNFTDDNRLIVTTLWWYNGHHTLISGVDIIGVIGTFKKKYVTPLVSVNSDTAFGFSIVSSQNSYTENFLLKCIVFA